jgi:hypothetical protein
VLGGARSAVPRSERDAQSRRESVARAALEDQYGRALSDAEWESAKRNLLAFIRLLVEWDRSPAGENTPGMPVGNLDRT